MKFLTKKNLGGICAIAAIATIASLGSAPIVLADGHGAKGLEILSVPDVPVSGPYSHGVKAGGLLFLSGVIALDPETKEFAAPVIEDQTHQVFKNIIAILAADGKTLNDVVKVSVFLKDPADFKPMNAVYETYFTDHKPARTTVPGVDWGHPSITLEIDIIATAD